MNKYLIAWLCFQGAVMAHAAPPAPSKTERYERRCQSQAALRTVKPQGTMLWGTRRSWYTEKQTDERSSVLVSASLEPLRQADTGVAALRLEGGHLEASPATRGVVGTVLQGTDSQGRPVEVAICGAEPSPEDPGMVWYRIETWNAVAQEWENPCVALEQVPDPRALAVGGVWDASGARQDVPGRITFACENGAITKCIRWGYKPWESRDGQPLTDLHQACTRMARADYCGNGRSHTHRDTIIDMYDRLGVLARTVESSAEWNPALASFEAAWAPNGATCLARTRDGRALEAILEECPRRFRRSAELDLGEGDRCSVQRVGGGSEAALLRNQSYGGTPRSAASEPCGTAGPCEGAVSPARAPEATRPPHPAAG